MKKRNTSIRLVYACDKCNTGVIQTQDSRTHNECVMRIKKCTHCKYQYAINEFMASDLTFASEGYSKGPKFKFINE